MGAEIIPLPIQGVGELSRPAAERLIDGNPEQRLWNLYSSRDGRFHAGHWACSTGSWRVHYTESELCHLLSGRVELRSAAGRVWRFGAGDSFVVPAGFEGIWAVLEPCTKLYASYEASPEA